MNEILSNVLSIDVSDISEELWYEVVDILDNLDQPLEERTYSECIESIMLGHDNKWFKSFSRSGVPANKLVSDYKSHKHIYNDYYVLDHRKVKSKYAMTPEYDLKVESIDILNSDIGKRYDKDTDINKLIDKINDFYIPGSLYIVVTFKYMKYIAGSD